MDITSAMIQQVKDDLPNVKVKVGTKIVEGRIVGRNRPYPIVIFDHAGVTIDAEWSWQAITRSVLTDKPLVY
jgi:hypothetical protein